MRNVFLVTVYVRRGRSNFSKIEFYIIPYIIPKFLPYILLPPLFFQQLPTSTFICKCWNIVNIKNSGEWQERHLCFFLCNICSGNGFTRMILQRLLPIMQVFWTYLEIFVFKFYIPYFLWNIRTFPCLRIRLRETSYSLPNLQLIIFGQPLWIKM